MWKVFGVETNIVAVGNVWADQIIELSKRKKGRPRFMEMMENAEISYAFEGAEAVHVFTVRLPGRYLGEDIDYMKAFLLKVIRSSSEPTISLLDEPQKFSVVITSDMPKDVYRGLRWKVPPQESDSMM